MMAGTMLSSITYRPALYNTYDTLFRRRFSKGLFIVPDFLIIAPDETPEPVPEEIQTWQTTVLSRGDGS